MLTSLLHARKYDKGEYVVQEGEHSDTLYIVHQGCVKLSRYAQNGKEHIIRFLFPGDFFGQAALLHQKPHDANAEVLESSALCSIHKNHFDLMLERYPKLAYHFLLAISDLLGATDEWNSAISSMNTEQKIAKLLLYFHTRNYAPNEIRLPVYKKDMALLLGITPETLSRKLAAMQNQGLLQVTGNCILILQLEQIKESCGCGASVPTWASP
ncbi:Crp/Fnr family transcriptional regulator [Paenibacillus pabuli]|nr:Crp/Fnr family transcriptional regulator [Paenibacillus pabuli]